MAALRQDDEHVPQAQPPPLERRRSPARLAERPYNPADPDNRRVAAELERRWEAARRDLPTAAERRHRPQPRLQVAEVLSAEEREAFRQAGKKIPEWWRQGRLTPPQQQAFRRCLIDQVVIQRSAPDTLQVRSIWRGGDTTAAALPVTGGALARLSSAKQMEKEIRRLARAGKTDEAIAALRTRHGHRSPQPAPVLPSTVRILRLRHRLLRKRSQSHPRRSPGHRTVPQRARALKITPPWIDDRIHNGTIQVALDPTTNLYLFPDQPKTITLCKHRRAGKLQQLRF